MFDQEYPNVDGHLEALSKDAMVLKAVQKWA